MSGKFAALIGLTLGLLIPSTQASATTMAVNTRLPRFSTKMFILRNIPSVNKRWLSMVVGSRLGGGRYHITGNISRPKAFLTVRDRFNRFCFSVQGD